MRVSRIFQDQVLATGAEIQLDQRASHYLKNVLRIAVGAPLCVFNGEGGEYPAEVTLLEKKAINVTLGDFNSNNRASPFSVHLVQSIARGEKMDWILQKAVELGVSEITPVFSERSEVRLKGERLQKRLQHWQGVIISACEQSGLNILPRLHQPQKIEGWLSQARVSPILMMHPEADSLDARLLEKTDSVTLMVGPEGGFSELEREQAQQKEIKTYSFGPRVLRTETAGIAAITLMQYLKGDLN